MKTLHLLAGGGIGGIERLCADYAKNSRHENVFLFIWNTGQITEDMKENGLTVISLDMEGYNVLRIFHRVLTICRKLCIQSVVVHHASPLAHMCLIWVKWRLPSLITIAYAHGHAADMYRENEKRGLRARKFVLTRSLKTADHVIAISNMVKNSLVDNFRIDPSHVTVLYNGVDVHRFLSKLHPIQTCLNLVYIGRLVRLKGVQIILESLAKLPQNIPVHLSIVGDGDFRTILEQESRRLGLEGYVDFLGTQRDIPRLLAKASVFIHVPIWEEGFGITIVEAMAAGLICVCSSSGAIPEIITNGVNGYLIDKGDADGLAKVLVNIWEQKANPELVALRLTAQEMAGKYDIRDFSHQLDQLVLHR